MAPTESDSRRNSWSSWSDLLPLNNTARVLELRDPVPNEVVFTHRLVLLHQLMVTLDTLQWSGRRMSWPLNAAVNAAVSKNRTLRSRV